MNLYAEDCVIVGDCLYMVARLTNLLYKVDLKSARIEIIDRVCDSPATLERAVGQIIEHDSKLYFMPMNAHNLCCFDLSNATWTVQTIEQNDECYCDRFFCGAIYGETVHMIGNRYPAIVSVDLKTSSKKMTGTTEYGLLKSNQKKYDDCYIRKDIAIVDEKIYAVSCVSNNVFVFDLQSGKLDVRSIGEKNLLFSGIAYDGNNFWIAARKKLEFYRWNINTNEFYTYKICDVKEDNFYLGGAIYDGNNVIFTGLLGSDTYLIDPNASDVMQSLKKIDGQFTFIKNDGNIDYCMRQEGIVELRSTNDFTRVIKKIDVNVDNHTVFSYIEKLDGSILLNESNIFTLEGFLEGLV